MVRQISEAYFQSACPVWRSVPRDPNLVSPVTGRDLVFTKGGLSTADGSERYPLKSGIARLFVEEQISSDEARSSNAVTRAVQAFYEETPFPDYNEFNSLENFLKRAAEGVFANLLRAQIPINAKLLEVGCGTGQLSNFLAATTMAHVYATDMTLASLQLGQQFAATHRIWGITYLQMNLFRPAIRPGSMDILLSNGVLHHTADTRRAFLSIATLVRPGGHIIIGLYDQIGRIRTNIRRKLYKLFGERVLALDPQLRNNLAPQRRQAWIKDQYSHPHERTHTISEVLTWLEAADFAFVSSIPKICGHFTRSERLFAPQEAGTPMDRFAAELAMIFDGYGADGGLFIVIGRRR